MKNIILKDNIFAGLSENAKKALLKTIQDLRFTKLYYDNESTKGYTEDLPVPRREISVFEITLWASSLEIEEKIELEIHAWHDKLFKAKIFNILLDEELFVKNGLEAVSSVTYLSDK